MENKNERIYHCLYQPSLLKNCYLKIILWGFLIFILFFLYNYYWKSALKVSSSGLWEVFQRYPSEQTLSLGFAVLLCSCYPAFSFLSSTHHQQSTDITHLSDFSMQNNPYVNFGFKNDSYSLRSSFFNAFRIS